MIKEYLRNNLLYIFAGLGILVIILIEAQGKGDFNIFISASRDLLSGKNIYHIWYNQWYNYYYDLLFALILVPFTYLPLYVVKALWLVLNVFFVYRIWMILVSWLPLEQLKGKSRIFFIILSFVFILSFLRDNFHLSQLTIFMLYMILEGLFLIEHNKKIPGSILLAFAINVKLLPVLVVPYLIYRKEWKPALYIIGFMILFLFVPVIFLGFEYTRFLLLERWNLINPMNQSHILDTSERSFHSLSTLLSTLLVKDCGDYQHALHLKRNIADISVENLNIVINIVRGILILFFLYFLRTSPFKNTPGKLQRLYEVSYLCLIIPLIFPHQQYYAFFFIFPASTYLIYYLIYLFFDQENRMITRLYKLKKILLIIFLSIVYFLTNSHFILGQFNHIYDHYKTLTYGVLILMILLAICRPDKILKVQQPAESSGETKS